MDNFVVHSNERACRKIEHLGLDQVNWYWNQHPQHHVITVPTRTIIHPRLEVNAVTYFHAITKSECNRTQVKKYIPRQPICLTDSVYDYILEEIGCRGKMGLKDM